MHRPTADTVNQNHTDRSNCREFVASSAESMQGNLRRTCVNSSTDLGAPPRALAGEATARPISAAVSVVYFCLRSVIIKTKELITFERSRAGPLPPDLGCKRRVRTAADLLLRRTD